MGRDNVTFKFRIDLTQMTVKGRQAVKILQDLEKASGGAATYADLNFSAISMQVQLLGGNNAIMKETEAKILEDLAQGNGDIGSAEYSGSAYTVRVSWTDTGLIKLEKV